MTRRLILITAAIFFAFVVPRYSGAQTSKGPDIYKEVYNGWKWWHARRVVFPSARFGIFR